MHDFVGIDLLLPEENLGEAVVSKLWQLGPTGKPVLVKPPVGATLADLLRPGRTPAMIDA
jgi:hypothetical protein